MHASWYSYEKSNEEHSWKTKFIVKMFFFISFHLMVDLIKFIIFLITYSYKCDGQCAIEMSCPTDLIFDNKNQRCEWVSQQFRMASLKADESLSKLLQKNSRILDLTSLNYNSSLPSTATDSLHKNLVPKK
jgi:hypothetical protein